MEKQNKRRDLYISIGLVAAGVIILIFALSSLGNFTGRTIGETNGIKEFNNCLADNGIVIYGSEWCPACRNLVETLGGYGAVENVYVECTVEQERCSEETKTGYVPEIQIDGEVYEGPRGLADLSELTGCKIPN